MACSVYKCPEKDCICAGRLLDKNSSIAKLTGSAQKTLWISSRLSTGRRRTALPGLDRRSRSWLTMAVSQLPVLSKLAPVRIVEHLLACTKNSHPLHRRFDDRECLACEGLGVFDGCRFVFCFVFGLYLRYFAPRRVYQKSRYTRLVVVVNTACFLWISPEKRAESGTCSGYKAVNNFVWARHRIWTKLAMWINRQLSTNGACGYS